MAARGMVYPQQRLKKLTEMAFKNEAKLLELVHRGKEVDYKPTHKLLNIFYSQDTVMLIVEHESWTEKVFVSKKDFLSAIRR